MRKELIVRTLIPRKFFKGQNDKLVLWASDVTDYEAAGFEADTDTMHNKHYLVRNMTIVGTCDVPVEHAEIRFDSSSSSVAEEAKANPASFM